MSLSKVYRGGETADLKEFRFRSFGEGEPQPPVEPKAAFTPTRNTEKSVAKAAATEPVAPVMPPLDTSKQQEEAFARGRQEGLAEGEARLASVSKALTQALEEVSRLRESLAKAGSEDMLRLVMAIAEQVIRCQAKADPQVILAVIENALKASVRADSYRLRLNPADLEVVTGHKPLFLASISGLKNLNIDADPEISQGGCQVESDLGDVDATIESQLDAIRQALDAAVAES